MITLNTPISQITPIGKTIAPKLKKLGVNTAQDLLFYFPFRWEDWSKIKSISALEPETNATIKGQIELIQNKRSKWKKRLITEAIIADKNDHIKAIWFHQPYLIQNIKPGDHIFLSGKVTLKPDGLQFVHPNYEKISNYKNHTTHTARIVPIYPLTKNLTEKQIRFVISKIIFLTNKITEWLPENIIQTNKLLKLGLALKQIHFPDNNQLLNQARNRLKFNELFLIQLHSAIAKQELKQAQSNKINFNQKQTKKFVDSLPFKLTDSQKISSWEIIQDLGKKTPMNRLLEGDVGSGKTIVACLGILNTALNKFQTAYMAPTEILAEQHFNNISQLFKNYPLTMALVTRSNKKTTDKKIKNIHKSIQTGKIDLIIGTQALIQDKITFNRLGLVIIDEQHRFGVSQRKKLKQKGIESKTNVNKNHIPHFLSMTATPIPRSLALTAYGDLDLSIINQMPLGRKKIITEIVPPESRPDKYKFILNQIKTGQQAFIICPLIDPSDKLGVKAVKDEYEKLNQKIFPDINIGLMHGRLKPTEKEKTMRDFIENKTKILVSTPVIEVGIDVPNATIIIIESAERFGLAQLHQFRGRVGRSEQQSYCFLFTESTTEPTIKRLQALKQCSNGFELAEKDLEFRGPGEIYGIKQSGYKDQLKIAKLTDYLIIKQTKNAAQSLIAVDYKLSSYPSILSKLKQFEQNIHLE